MEIKELVRAIRCANTAGQFQCIGKECPYFVKATEEEKQEFMKKYGEYPEELFESCDTDKIMLDAADALESIAWHDLEKNPDDLPEELEDVYVEFEYFRYGDYNGIVKSYGISYQVGGRFNTANGSTGWKDLKVLKWMRIPVPKEGDHGTE